jgi:hypothetical protein
MITLIRNLLRNLRERNITTIPDNLTEAQKRQRELHYRLVRLELETRLQARKGHTSRG